MPKYDYQCEKCGAFEAQQSFQDAALEKCPACGGPVSRMISRNVNFVFKGSGFYATEYRSEEYKRQAAADVKAPQPVCASTDKPCPMASGACPAQVAPKENSKEKGT
jgi:putative FmdB family regulatory protein